MRVAILMVFCTSAAFSFADSEKSHIVRDGSSAEHAVIMRGLSIRESVRREWEWIRKFHPTAEVTMHQTIYDRYILDTPAGQRDAYFELGKKCD